MEINKPYLLTREQWNGILECKKNFINNGISPLDHPLMRKEVAESWLRSKAYRLDPDKQGPLQVLNKHDFNRLKEKNKLLIDAAAPLLDTFKPLITISNYFFILFDKNGIPLIERGSQRFMADSDTADHGLGLIISEENSGTQAHLLTIRYSCPVQLIGPEHYCTVFSENISTSAPIFDENGQMLGCLLLVVYRNDAPWNKEFHSMQAHSFGWVTSIALALEKQIQLHHQNGRLINSNKTLEATLSYLDEAVITVDEDGKILGANQEGRNLFSLDQNSLKGKKLASFFHPDSQLMKLIMSGSKVDMVEDILTTKTGSRSYLFSSRPVFNEDNTCPQGAIIRISSIKKMNLYIASHSSSIAHYTFDSIVGASDPLVKAKEIAKRFANTPENILLIGESGTGKELFAQAIHNQSRPDTPFIALNCAAMPRNLVESELFGYEGGSFTGAERKGRAGKIELANNGTLFLDEIGDMPLELQGVLLRVLEDKQVMRIGGNRYHKVDFRLISATNQDLLKKVQEKMFRADLYYRLAAMKINIPNLAKRGEDILILAELFLDEYSKKIACPRPSLSQAVKELLINYSWPGNVRQLEKAMSYAVSMAAQGIIETSDLPEEISGVDSVQWSITEEKLEAKTESISKGILSLQEAEEITIRKVLLYTNKNIDKAANILGIGKSTLYRKIKDFGIDLHQC